jgi:hypothetical protein
MRDTHGAQTNRSFACVVSSHERTPVDGCPQPDGSTIDLLNGKREVCIRDDYAQWWLEGWGEWRSTALLKRIKRGHAVTNLKRSDSN